MSDGTTAENLCNYFPKLLSKPCLCPMNHLAKSDCLSTFWNVTSTTALTVSDVIVLEGWNNELDNNFDIDIKKEGCLYHQIQNFNKRLEGWEVSHLLHHQLYTWTWKGLLSSEHWLAWLYWLGFQPSFHLVWRPKWYLEPGAINLPFPLPQLRCCYLKFPCLLPVAEEFPEMWTKISQTFASSFGALVFRICMFPLHYKTNRDLTLSGWWVRGYWTTMPIQQQPLHQAIW